MWDWGLWHNPCAFQTSCDFRAEGCSALLENVKQKQEGVGADKWGHMNSEHSWRTEQLQQKMSGEGWGEAWSKRVQRAASPWNTVAQVDTGQAGPVPGTLMGAGRIRVGWISAYWEPLTWTWKSRRATQVEKKPDFSGTKNKQINDDQVWTQSQDQVWTQSIRKSRPHQVEVESNRTIRGAVRSAKGSSGEGTQRAGLRAPFQRSLPGRLWCLSYRCEDLGWDH